MVTLALMGLIFGYLYARGGRSEPRGNLIRTVLLGSVGMLVGLFVGFPLRMLDVRSVSPYADAILISILFATIPGESVKFLVLRYYCKRLRTFKSVPAGIIYGGMAALGFMLADHMAFAAPQLQFISALRMFAAAPLHVATGAIMGLALAHQMFVRGSSWTMGKGWLFGVLAHSIFNLSWISAGMHRSLDGTSWFILYGLPGIACGLSIFLSVWMLRTLDRLHSEQLLRVATNTHHEAAVDPTYLQRLRDADRNEEME